MKTLYLMRHGEKELNPNKDDYDIELTKKGEEQVLQMAQKLKEQNINFDLIVSSPAQRARTTAQIVSDTIKHPKSVMFNEVIYNAFLNELMESISYTYDTVDTLLIIGHNPALASLAVNLTEFREELKMGGVVKITFNCNSWIDIAKYNAKYESYIEPK